MTEPSRRTTLARVRFLGSAKDGTAHWWMQRLTAVALVPLVLWFVVSMVMLTGASHGAFVGWLARPVPAILMLLLVVATFHHAQLGLQVVIEDYVAQPALRLVLLVLAKFAAVVLGVAAAFAVIKIALGA
ncbi:MAG: succinate dehydrogenase, hydrophobic membrane anchor protein [Alphaproteobacteria bacterium]|nr:succinate dehydrogenase, hydrophobic membrane anchor protein [Alphaproteobacteria bacterium]